MAKGMLLQNNMPQAKYDTNMLYYSSNGASTLLKSECKLVHLEVAPSECFGQVS